MYVLSDEVMEERKARSYVHHIKPFGDGMSTRKVPMIFAMLEGYSVFIYMVVIFSDSVKPGVMLYGCVSDLKAEGKLLIDFIPDHVMYK